MNYTTTGNKKLMVHYSSLSMESTHYGSNSDGGLLDRFILDDLDEDQRDVIAELGIIPLVTNTWMRTTADRIELAQKVIEFGEIHYREYKQK